MRTLVCLSGGLDSAVVLDMAKEQGHAEAIMFDYGQRHIVELDYAARLVERAGVAGRRVRLPPIPLVDDVVFAGRNLVLASVAISIAAAEGFGTVAFGCNRSDWDRFPDCWPTFWDGIGEVVLGAYGVTLSLPLLHMTKTEIVMEARRRGIGETWSCYNPVGVEPCGKCLACRTLEAASA